jgi:Zn-dependent M16 (insulinase) family peptidase
MTKQQAMEIIQSMPNGIDPEEFLIELCKKAAHQERLEIADLLDKMQSNVRSHNYFAYAAQCVRGRV